MNTFKMNTVCWRFKLSFAKFYSLFIVQVDLYAIHKKNPTKGEAFNITFPVLDYSRSNNTSFECP